VLSRGELREYSTVIAERLVSLVLVVVANRDAEENLLRPGALRIALEKLRGSGEEDGRLLQPPRGLSEIELRFGSEVVAADFLQGRGRGRELAPMVLADSHLQAHELSVRHCGYLGARPEERGKRLVGVGVALLGHEELGAVKPESFEPQGLDRGKLRPHQFQLSAGPGSSRMPWELVVQGLERERRLRVLLGLEETRSELVERLSPKFGVLALRDLSKHRHRTLAVSRAPQEPGENETRLVEDRDVAMVGIEPSQELPGIVGTARLELERREIERVAG